MKKASLKSNLVLAAIAVTAGLVLYATYQQERLPGDDDRQVLLPGLAEAMPGNIYIWRDGYDSGVNIFRDGTAWKIHSYSQFPAIPADRLRVENLLRQLATLQVQLVTTTGENNSLYINDPPKFIIQVDQQQVTLGKNNIVDYRRYLEHNGNIYLAADELAPILGGQQLFFAAHNLLPENFIPVAITINGKKTVFANAGRAGSIARLAWEQGRALLVEYDDSHINLDDEKLLYVTGQDGDNIIFVATVTENIPMLIRPDLYIRYQLSQTLWQELVVSLEGGT